MLRFCSLFVSLILLAPPLSDAAEGLIPSKDKGGPLVHRSSGFTFPLLLGKFHRVMPHQYDAAGYDVSVGYNLEFPPVAVTIYVYQAGQASLEQEFARRQAEVTGVHPAARLVAQGATTVSPEKVRALSADYTYDEKFAGAVQPVRSTLLVARHGEQFVEYRISYTLGSAPVAAKLSRQFTQDFAWP